ncbi:hypothetical protein HBB16_05205 [Pseudonocardia sp. MCCB 268]|nr:hypothetical protein [Pseudonocardia cytotoxica]
MFRACGRWPLVLDRALVPGPRPRPAIELGDAAGDATAAARTARQRRAEPRLHGGGAAGWGKTPRWAPGAWPADGLGPAQQPSGAIGVRAVLSTARCAIMSRLRVRTSRAAGRPRHRSGRERPEPLVAGLAVRRAGRGGRRPSRARPAGVPMRLLEALCRDVPERLHVVLISRQMLPFTLTRLRGRGLVADVRAPDLALRDAEITTVLRARLGQEPGSLTGLVRECTRLAGRGPAGRRGAGADEATRREVVERLVDPGEVLHTYIAEEVVAPEPEPVRELLGRLAVLGEASSGLAVPDGCGAAVLVELTARGRCAGSPAGSTAGRWSRPGIVLRSRTGAGRRAARTCIAGRAGVRRSWCARRCPASPAGGRRAHRLRRAARRAR